MSMASSVAAAAIRAGAVGSVAVAIGLPLSALQATTPRRWCWAVWALLLLPYLVPALLVGHAWRQLALALVHHPAANKALYSLLTMMKLVPVAALVLVFAPRPLSAQAIHCRRLAGGGRFVWDWSFLVRGRLGDCAVAFLPVFLLAFGEFEVASRMTVSTWTVVLFDQHAGGQMLSESLSLVMLPVVCELVVLAVVLVMLFGVRSAPVRVPPPAARLRRPTAWLCGLYLACAAFVVGFVPLGLVAWRASVGAAQGPGETRRLLLDASLWRELGAGAFFGAAAACCAYAAAVWVGRLRRGALPAAVGLCVPGLLGPLVLALVAVAVFQAPLLRSVYDTPLPLVITLALLVTPFAVVLLIFLRRTDRSAALHGAELLAASPETTVRRARGRLLWELWLRPRFWVLFLLFCWGYSDLVAGAILAPAAMTTAPVRLYNLMHYGWSHRLSAMILVFVALPPVAGLAVWAGQRMVSWWLRPCPIRSGH